MAEMNEFSVTAEIPDMTAEIFDWWLRQYYPILPEQRAGMSLVAVGSGFVRRYLVTIGDESDGNDVGVNVAQRKSNSISLTIITHVRPQAGAFISLILFLSDVLYIEESILLNMLNDFKQHYGVTQTDGSENSLSNRETEVLDLLMTGKMQRAIAEILMIENSTVKTHLKNISVRWGMDTYAQGAIQREAQRRFPNKYPPSSPAN